MESQANPYPGVDNILPRGQDDNQVLLNNLSLLIDSAVDFGTHLLEWEAQNNLIGDEHIVHLLFFRNILETADALAILIRNSAVDAAKSLLRVLIENVFSLEYLLAENFKERALSYLVWNFHKDLKFFEKLNKSSEKGKQFSAELKKDKIIGSIELKEVDYHGSKANVEELLKLPVFAAIDAEYQRTSVKFKNCSWFSLFDGPRDIDGLAKKVSLNATYEIHYRAYSANVHGTDVYKNKLLGNDDGTADIIQMRYPKDCHSVTGDTLNFLLLAIMTFQRKRLPSRQADFDKWYSIFGREYREFLAAKEQDSN